MQCRTTPALDLGADVSTRDQYGNTLLQLYYSHSSRNLYSLTKFPSFRATDIYSKNNEGISALDIILAQSDKNPGHAWDIIDVRNIIDFREFRRMGLDMLALELFLSDYQGKPNLLTMLASHDHGYDIIMNCLAPWLEKDTYLLESLNFLYHPKSKI